MLSARHLCAVLTLVLCTLTSTSLGLAQEGPPIALLTSPDPALCTIAPRSRSNFEALVTMGRATPAMAAPPEPHLPVGKPADPATIEAVTQTAVELFACYAAGDLLRASALWTDAYLARMYALVPYPVDDFVGLSTPPEPEALADRPMLLALRDVTLLPDGRVGSFLELAYPDGSTETQYGIVTLIDGRYRLDEVVLDAELPGMSSPGATPTVFTDPDATTLLERYRVAGNTCEAFGHVT